MKRSANSAGGTTWPECLGRTCCLPTSGRRPHPLHSPIPATPPTPCPRDCTSGSRMAVGQLESTPAPTHTINPTPPTNLQVGVARSHRGSGGRLTSTSSHGIWGEGRGAGEETDSITHAIKIHSAEQVTRGGSHENCIFSFIAFRQIVFA